MHLEFILEKNKAIEKQLATKKGSGIIDSSMMNPEQNVH